MAGKEAGKAVVTEVERGMVDQGRVAAAVKVPEKVEAVEAVTEEVREAVEMAVRTVKERLAGVMEAAETAKRKAATMAASTAELKEVHSEASMVGSAEASKVLSVQPCSSDPTRSQAHHSRTRKGQCQTHCDSKHQPSRRSQGKRPQRRRTPPSSRHQGSARQAQTRRPAVPGR